jgi:hypothetical protein
MGLDRDSEQKVCTWLAQKGQHVCPICQGKAWGIGDLVGLTIVPTPLTGTGLNLSGAGVSLFVPLTCLNCAYVILLSAAPMGLTSTANPSSK